jgi:hypothetical protein
MSIIIPDFVEDLIKKGLQVEVYYREYRESKGIVFDLQLGAKSGMHLFQDALGKYHVYMRYDETFPVEDLDDLLSCALHGMHGRDYINSFWADLLVEHGYLKRTSTTTTTLERA